MRLFFLALIVAFASPALAHSPSACPTPAPEADAPLDFVGATEAVAQGQVGRNEWLQMCRAEFPGSRVCTTRDLIETGTTPLPAVTEALWVMPHWIDSAHEYSGRIANPAGCKALYNTGDYPLPIFQDGASCNNFHSVACCALVP